MHTSTPAMTHRDRVISTSTLLTRSLRFDKLRSAAVVAVGMRCPVACVRAAVPAAAVHVRRTAAAIAFAPLQLPLQPAQLLGRCGAPLAETANLRM